MNVDWSNLLTVGLPLFIVWLTVKVAPDFVGKLLFKPIEHASEARLATLKDDLNKESTLTINKARTDLEATYSTLKTSVDVLSAGQSGMRTEVISAVKLLWAEIITLRDTYGTVVSFNELFTTSEIEAALSGTAPGQIRQWLSIMRSKEQLDKKSAEAIRKELDEARLFCGDRLWLLYYMTRSIYLRLAWLTNKSAQEEKWVDWRTDTGIPQFLAAVLSEDDMDQVKTQHQGLTMGMGRIEALYLHEASLVMSGSKAMSESLSDMQSVMLLQQQRARQDIMKKADEA